MNFFARFLPKRLATRQGLPSSKRLWGLLVGVAAERLEEDDLKLDLLH